MAVAGNLSAKQFRQRDLVRQVERTLMGEALAPHLLKLEITERAVVDDSHEAVRVVVAEGVETGQQMAFLRRQRCDALQGYLLARPGRIAELYRYVREAPAAFSAMAPAIVRTA